MTNDEIRKMTADRGNGGEFRYNAHMEIRPAKVSDAKRICELINYWAEKNLMLHRSLESVYTCLRAFLVAEADTQAVGCVALDIYWANLAEIRSLAVAPERKGRGVGAALVAAALDEAERLGLAKVFALTYEQEFFKRLGFTQVELKTLPEKVWRECLAWYAQGHRHETAMLYEFSRRDVEHA
jgi:amino-acid N-acetyltransferase